jgi:hypothetical protein
VDNYGHITAVTFDSEGNLNFRDGKEEYSL